MHKILAIAALLLPISRAAEIPVSKGFEHFYNLEYEEAIQEFRSQVEKEPENPNAYNHLAQAILYREMFRAGALESELVSGTNPFLKREKLQTTSEAAKQFDEAVGKAMSLSEANIAKNADDADALYSIGVTYGLRANYNFLVRKAWMDSLRDATNARKAHNRVVELRPTFIDARLAQGAHDYIVGSLPWQYKLLGFVAGIRGDREQGIKTLRLVAEQGTVNKYDAQVILAAIYRREREPEQALPLLDKLVARFPRNYLFRLEKVQMYSDEGDKDSALAVLDKVEELQADGAPGYGALKPAKIHYYRGNLLFWYRDLQRAAEELQRATAHSSGLDTHTAMMAWLRLGQVNDMLGNRKDARRAYEQAIAAAPQSDAAKESRRYLSSPYRRS